MKKSLNFMALPPALTDPSRSKYAVLPVPYEATVTYKSGTAAGPAAILEASAQVERFDEELLADFTGAGITTLSPLKAARTPHAQIERVRRAAADILAKGKFPLTLGGEHSITAGLVQAVVERHGRVSVLQIDAHADLRNSYGGTEFSHASVMRRVLEMTPSVCQVGIRNFSAEEYRSCPAQAAKFVTPAAIERDSRWINRVLRMLKAKVYVTIDIDGFDPSIAPGTGTPEPGGLTWRQVTAMLREVCAKRNVVGADIVEVRPIGPHHVTEFLAARLAYKIVAYTQQPERAAILL